MGRTRAARLRCFGNAICLPLATAFVEAVIESFADAALRLGVDSIELPRAAAVAVQAIAEEAPSAALAWTGPLEGETAPSGMLFGRVPHERWPYGPPSAHEDCCNLFPRRGSPGGLFCDCAASAADAVEQGVGA